MRKVYSCSLQCVSEKGTLYAINGENFNKLKQNDLSWLKVLKTAAFKERLIQCSTFKQPKILRDSEQDLGSLDDILPPQHKLNHDINLVPNPKPAESYSDVYRPRPESPKTKVISQEPRPSPQLINLARSRSLVSVS